MKSGFILPYLDPEGSNRHGFNPSGVKDMTFTYPKNDDLLAVEGFPVEYCLQRVEIDFSEPFRHQGYLSLKQKHSWFYLKQPNLK